MRSDRPDFVPTARTEGVASLGPERLDLAQTIMGTEGVALPRLLSVDGGRSPFPP